MSGSLNVSQHLDQVSLELLLAVDAAASALDIAYCVVGAFARDVVLGGCFGINTGQATRDIDFGLMLNDWDEFTALRWHLLQDKKFAEHPTIPHRLRFQGARELDLVPFGGIERQDGEIARPPDFGTVMSTVGLRQTQAHAIRPHG